MTNVPNLRTDATPKGKHDGCCGGQHDHDKQRWPTATPPAPKAPGKPSQHASHGAAGHEPSGSGCCGGGKPSA